MEAFLAVLLDTKAFEGINRKLLSGGIAFSCFLFSLMYATDAGLIFLDAVDYYINFVMLFVGGVECFAAGWVYKIEEQIETLGADVVIGYIVTTFGSVVVACAVWFGMNDSDPDTALWAGFVGLIVCYAVGMAFIFYLMSKKKQADPSLTWKDMCYALFMKNVMDLRRDLSEVVGPMPAIWAFLIKHFIPPIVLILFALGADSKQFWSYEGYVKWPYQVLGILVVIFVGFLFISSLAFPKMYDFLAKPGTPEDTAYPAEESEEVTGGDDKEKQEDTAYPAEDKDAAGKGEVEMALGTDDAEGVETAPEEHVA